LAARFPAYRRDRARPRETSTSHKRNPVCAAPLILPGDSAPTSSSSPGRARAGESLEFGGNLGGLRGSDPLEDLQRLPTGEVRTAKDAIDGLLELSQSEESRARQLACRNLCTCHVRADDDRVWTRLLELAGDPDPRVRGDVIHAITDSTPASRVPAVIQALESRHNDPDVGIRRRVRKTLAHYRRTGKLTDAAH